VTLDMLHAWRKCGRDGRMWKNVEECGRNVEEMWKNVEEYVEEMWKNVECSSTYVSLLFS
jgi:hypothetical protein